MSESEVIFTAGLAGGCISLHGMRQSDTTWLFFHETDESIHRTMLSDEEKEGLVFRRNSAVSETLEDALKRLDEKYKWHRFYPLHIHPEFADILLSFVRKRCIENPGQMNELDVWEYLVEHPSS